MGYYATPNITVTKEEVAVATFKLWNNSVDEPLAANLGGKKDEVQEWRTKRKPVEEGIIESKKEMMDNV